MNESLKRSPRRARALVAIALSLVALVPLLPVVLGGRFPRNHDGIRYELLTRLLIDAFRHGIGYPRWLPDLAGGAGYPTLIYYQPLVFYVAAACSAVPGVTTSTAVYVAAYVLLLVGAGGAYRVARLHLTRAPALAVAALCLLTPYLFVNLLVRGDFSEAAAMLIAPWPIWSIVMIERRLRAARSPRGAIVVAATSLTAICYAHPAVALFFVPTLFALAAVHACAVEDRSRLLRIYVAIGAFAAVASSPYWLVLWQHAGFAHLERAVDARYAAADYTVPIERLMSRRWGFGASLPAPGRTPLRVPDAYDVDPMATPLGLPHALLAVAGLVVAIRARRPLPVAAGAIATALVFAMTPFATPFWTHAGTLVRLVQFPWRLLAVIAPLSLVLVASACSPSDRPAWRVAVPCALVALSATWYAPMFRLSPRPFDLAGGPRVLSWRDADTLVDGEIAGLHFVDQPMAGANEFEPVWVTRHDRPRGAAPLVLARVPVREASTSDAYRIDVDLDSPRPDAAVINQSYFPGWRVLVNGREIYDADLRAGVTPEGKMVVPVPAGRSRIVAFYDGPPFWRARVAVTAALLAAIGAWLARASRIAGILPLHSVADGDGR